MANRTKVTRGLIVSTVVFAMLGVAASCEAAESPGASTGVWQKHEYRFQFMGFTSTYSCDGLADKLALLLRYAGARKDVKASAGGCPGGFGEPDKMSSAYLTFYTLGQGTSDSGDKPVAAEWRSVVMSARRPIELGAGDCELVDQFRAELLKMFTTRNVESRMSCVPHQVSGSSIDLKFEVLAPPEKTKKS